MAFLRLHLYNGLTIFYADTCSLCFLQIHYLLNLGAEINQRDDKGFTPLHRAAYLAQYDGYMEIYEYLMVSWFTSIVFSLTAMHPWSA